MAIFVKASQFKFREIEMDGVYKTRQPSPAMPLSIKKVQMWLSRGQEYNFKHAECNDLADS